MIVEVVFALITKFILPRTWRLTSKAVDILLEATPARIDAQEVEQIMKTTEGVDLVHDLHIWSITSDLISLSAHVVVNDGIDQRQEQKILTQINERLRKNFDIDHTTIQIEYSDLQAKEPQL